jgi:hypothetical protein
MLGPPRDVAGTVADALESPHAAVRYLPPQSVGDSLRRPPADVEVVVVQRVEQLGDGRGTVLR